MTTLEERLEAVWRNLFFGDCVIDRVLTITKEVLETLRENVGEKAGSSNYVLASQLDHIIKNIPANLDDVRKIDAERGN